MLLGDTMLGSIIGDIIGSRFEFMATQELLELEMEFFHPASNFTDDTVCLSAITKISLFAKEHNEFNKNLKNKYPEDYIKEVKFNKEKFYQLKYTEQLIEYFNQFYMAGYGQKFSIWCKSEVKTPYHSLGNGALMRISSIPMIFDSLEESLLFCDFATEITHNHPESIRMTHLFIEILWYLLHSEDNIEEKKIQILNLCQKYSLPIDSVENYHVLAGFNVLVHETLKRSISSVLEADSFQKVMQNVLYIGSDTDTTACIAGAMAELLFGLENSWINLTIKKFNHQNIPLLQNIIPIYKDKDNYSSHIKNIIFNQHKIDIYDKIKHLVLLDPTASWDPLEVADSDEYYSEADYKLQENYKKQRNLWQKLLGFFKKDF